MAPNLAPKRTGATCPVRSPERSRYYGIVPSLTGVDADTLAKASRCDLADSALHALQAGFGDVVFYPEAGRHLGCCRLERRRAPPYWGLERQSEDHDRCHGQPDEGEAGNDLGLA
jgi:death-on-curing protein